MAIFPDEKFLIGGICIPVKLLVLFLLLNHIFEKLFHFRSQVIYPVAVRGFGFIFFMVRCYLNDGPFYLEKKITIEKQGASSSNKDKEYKCKIFCKEEIIMFEEYEDIVTAEEAAKMLRVGKRRMYDLLKAGSIKAYREGRVWRISRNAVQKYVMEHSGL